MNTIGGFLTETISALGQTFIMAYYLPAALFLLVQTQVLAPIWADLDPRPAQIGQVLPTSQGPEEVASPAAPAAGAEDSTDPVEHEDASSQTGASWLANLGEDLFSFLVLLATPFLIGVALFGMNDLLIVGYEGKLSWLQDGLLARSTRRNRERSRDLYGKLPELREEYARLQGQIQTTIASEELLPLQQLRAGLIEQIGQTHAAIEKQDSMQSLPCAEFRIGPNRFGNAYATAEEYAYERYGMDAVLFWGRLRTLMEEQAPTLTGQLVQQKTLVDQSLNLSFLSGLVLLEGVITLIATLASVSVARHGLALLLVFAGSAGLTVCFYYVAVSRVQVMGELLKQSFDYHRHLVLNAFELQKPASLAEERRLWMRLGAFIRRGDDFYFPAEHQAGRSDTK